MSRLSPYHSLNEVLSGYHIQLDRIHDLTESATAERHAQLHGFLSIHLSLIPLLDEIATQLHFYFADSEIFLDFVTDPEEVSRQQIMVSVATRLAPGEALDRLRQFDRDWWLGKLDQSQGKICIDVTFR